MTTREEHGKAWVDHCRRVLYRQEEPAPCPELDAIRQQENPTPIDEEETW